MIVYVLKLVDIAFRGKSQGTREWCVESTSHEKQIALYSRTVLLHDLKKFDYHFRNWAHQNLALAPFLGVVHGLEGEK